MAPVVERPGGETELVAVLRQAAAARRPVTLAGPKGNEVGLDLSRYGRLLRVDWDAGLVTAEAGITVWGLGYALAQWGLCLDNGVEDPSLPLGVAVGWGAHGTGASFPGLASHVTALRLVGPGGGVVACSATEEPALFDAARVGLGAFGVISTVTLRCRPGFNLRVAHETVDLDAALADFDRLADGNDHLRIAWRQGDRRARVTTANRTDDPPDGRAVDRAYRLWAGPRAKGPAPVEHAVGRDGAGPVLAQLAGWRRGPTAQRPFSLVVTVTAGDDLPLSPAEGRPSVYIAGAGAGGVDGRRQWRPGDDPEAERARYPRFAEWAAVRDRLAYSSGQG